MINATTMDLPINQVIRGDGVEVMKRLPDKCVDLVLTDPPYNSKDIGPNHKKYNTGMMQIPQEQYSEFCTNWFNEAMRISKSLVFTPGIANVSLYPQPYWILCWHKPAAVSYNRMGGFNAWEPIFVYGKPAKNKRVKQDYLLFNTLNRKKGPEKDHPCPKPLSLWKFILDTFSNPHDIILDPFGGAGTTAVACLESSRRFIHIDISPDYCQITATRLNQIKAQRTLFQTTLKDGERCNENQAAPNG